VSTAAAPDIALSLKAMHFIRAWDALVERSTQRWAVPASALLRAEGERAAAVWEVTGSAQAAANAVDDGEWAAYMARVWIVTVPQAGAIVAAEYSIPKAGPPDIFVQAAINWLRLHGGDRVRGITQTSRDEIGNQIRIGVSKGEDRQQIADRIVKHRRSITPERALVIARTETHTAANFGSLTAVRDLALPMRKVWLARSGARPAHAAAGGQRQALDAAFSVGGYRMQHPGDSSHGAPAGLIANCRCVLTYESARRRAA